MLKVDVSQRWSMRKKCLNEDIYMKQREHIKAFWRNLNLSSQVGTPHTFISVLAVAIIFLFLFFSIFIIITHGFWKVNISLKKQINISSFVSFSLQKKYDIRVGPRKEFSLNKIITADFLLQFQKKKINPHRQILDIIVFFFPSTHVSRLSLG